MNAIDPSCRFAALNRRALVVENDAELAPLLTLLLQQEGYEVTLVADGRQAVQQIDRLAPPSLVLLETFLPYQGGFDLLRQIRAKPAWDRVSVVMLSNNASGTDGLRAREGGADACLVKPLRPESLRSLLPPPAPPAPLGHAVAAIQLANG